MAITNFNLALNNTPVKIFQGSTDGGACRSFWAQNTGAANIRVLVVGVHTFPPSSGAALPTVDATAMANGRTLVPSEQFTWGNTRGMFQGGQIYEVWADCPTGAGTISSDIVQR